MDKLCNHLDDDLIRVSGGPNHSPMVADCLAALTVQGSYKKLVEVVSGTSRKAS